MEQYLNSCRVCLGFVKNDAKSKRNLMKSFFEKSTSFKILPDEPQTCCSGCYGELMSLVRFIEKCEKTQNVLEEVRNGKSTEIGIENEMQLVEDYSQILNIDLKEEIKEETVSEAELDLHIKIEEKPKKIQKLKEPKPRKEKSTNAQTVICPFCGTFVKSSYLQVHIKLIHSGPRVPFICDICNTTLSSKKSVVRHMNRCHLKIDRYKCKICQMEFPSDAIRKSHLVQIHQVLPPKSCPFCDYRAFSSNHLSLHVQRHRGERRFKCTVCNFAFTTLSHLQRHQAIHSDARDFECDVCFKRFKTKRSVVAHKKCHLAYEYECEVCGKAFLTNQIMRNHVMRHHPEYELPPAGTVMNKEAVKRMKNIEAEILQCK